MKRLFSKGFTTIILALLIGFLVISFIGCSTSNQTAIQQMMDQTSDPILIGKAAYFDAAGIYTNTAKMYLNYKAMLDANHQDISGNIQNLLNEMKSVLDDWKSLTGMAQMIAVNDGSEAFAEKRRLIIFQLAQFMEGGK